jgi:DNA-binding MarR family transcriptional regulator
MAGPADRTGLDEQPRWLSAGEQAAWGPFVALLFRLPAALDQQLQRDAGITHFEYMVLSSLSETPDRTLRMGDLATMASGSLSRLSHVVSRLERRGWVRREPCSQDGRYINAVLTEEGGAKVAETAPGHVETVRRLLIDVLTPEQFRELGEASERVLKSLGLPAALGVTEAGELAELDGGSSEARRLASPGNPQWKWGGFPMGGRGFRP